MAGRIAVDVYCITVEVLRTPVEKKELEVMEVRKEEVEEMERERKEREEQ